ncbi:hypothetical protein [Nitrosococcus wardiae]|uniref:Uncharacterized protein n=1 Tax=Nitrosococcus wardiae TaxID=1814290 RepID=A0A4P7BZ88_9GAMM|nr:hypothetical protein [Nitrosococcus wardiae]QBQ53832.1 hypothetical protein E3U44_04375 [Nitrosococcus wardiae]
MREAFTPEDIEDWRNGYLPQDTLVAFAQARVQRRMMDKGKRPALYTEPATCQHYGPVWRGSLVRCKGVSLVLESDCPSADTVPPADSLWGLCPFSTYRPPAPGSLRPG